MIDIEKIMQKLRVGALEDITEDELAALIQYIENLQEIEYRYESVSH